MHQNMLLLIPVLLPAATFSRAEWRAMIAARHASTE